MDNGYLPTPTSSQFWVIYLDLGSSHINCIGSKEFLTNDCKDQFRLEDFWFDMPMFYLWFLKFKSCLISKCLISRKCLSLLKLLLCVSKKDKEKYESLLSPRRIVSQRWSWRTAENWVYSCPKIESSQTAEGYRIAYIALKVLALICSILEWLTV